MFARTTLEAARIPAGLNPAGQEAQDIAGLWWLMLALGTAAFALFLLLLASGAFRRTRSTDQAMQDRQDERAGWTWLLGGGVLLPLVLLVVVMVATVGVMREAPSAADAEASGAPVVEIVGHQWFYEVHYPSAGVTVRDELHLPSGREVVVKVTSVDVIHSFWVPELGGKIDMIPEDINTIVLRPQRHGRFTARCAEFCGIAHTKMTMRVIVEPQAEFESWLREQQDD